ncbi:hypothetical protein ATANTOWER_019558 [Ataeniobius toweri]|uniref:Uncharacterized protein n=1 Tax=Ataeniobius toweri TaxID=208326 RepID=A0ABU7A2E5_9TELE|nr:hypothetical protein [Ataeniobius toweri]
MLGSESSFFPEPILNFFQKVVWISETGGNQESAFCKRKRRKTPTRVHMALPFPLPSCANLDTITSEKSRGGSGLTAEMGDAESIRVCFFACTEQTVPEM